MTVGREAMLRPLFSFMSRQDWMKRTLLSLPGGRKLASRFVAGESIDEVLPVVRDLNRQGMLVTVDHLGEHETDPVRVQESLDCYLSLVERLAAEHVGAHVSVKLSEMGLDISPGACRENMKALLATAAAKGVFVRIDMESSVYTQRTLDLFHDLRGSFENVGVVVQAYLRRTGSDVERILGRGGRMRLCKGAYDEPPTVAFPHKRDVDENFLALGRRLLDSGLYHGLATHDTAMIDSLMAHARSRSIQPESFEFQMLYGVRRDLQEKIVRDGYRLRIYLPFGVNWYQYFMRRLAERPANVVFVARSIVGW